MFKFQIVCNFQCIIIISSQTGENWIHKKLNLLKWVNKKGLKCSAKENNFEKPALEIF